MEYIGEHLLPGKFGHLFVVLGFVSSILAVLAYFYATERRESDQYRSWRNIGRMAYSVHGFSVFAVIAIIFYMMINQYFEYQYVWAHVDDELPFRYIFSAFWEGQEGSFLLWMFWHVVLGILLMFSAKQWEAPVMAVIALIQVFIGSMILGLHFYFGDFLLKIGSSPFLLLRDVMDAPIFAKADYVSVINGQGLNPLLQNYWMTIHPPTLFLGFASTAVPFAYAIAGLWTRQHKAWLHAVLPWALFSGAILGTGILMGGAWAYEALSFGGYWAWDPVENMSLVPWLVLLAGIHTNLIARATGYSIKVSYLFYLLTFVLIVYSTFLTRSGVLGETSVHAFTEMGLEWQLISFIFAFFGLGLGLYFARVKGIPAPAKEESTSSKEFWMFIGSLVLLFSAALITASTSLPVYNQIRQLFEPLYEGGVINDPVAHYNKYQLWIAIFIGLLSGISQYLRYREFNWSGYQSKFLKHSLIAIGLSAGLTFLYMQWIEIRAWQYVLLLFTGVFTVVTNLDYIILFLKGNLKVGGSALSHIGFGLMIVGIMASGLNKRHISTNPFAQKGLIEGFTDEDYRKNVILMKGVPMFMSGYEVTYVGDTIDGFTRSFEVNYKRKDETGKVEEEFSLYPNVLYDKGFNKVAAVNPSTKHYYHKDIFTHIASLPLVETDPKMAQQMEDSLDYELYQVVKGDTFYTKKYFAQLEEIVLNPAHPDYEAQAKDMALGVRLAIRRLDSDATWYANPMLLLRNNMLYSFPDQINDLNLKVRLPESIFEQTFAPEESLDYQDYNLKKEDAFFLNGHQIKFIGFNPKPSHPNYVAQEGDIAVSALIEITPKGSQETRLVAPVYLIRDSRPYNLKDQLLDLGLHFRFTEIDPKSEKVNVKIALQDVGLQKTPVEIAENFRRSDYIVLEAIVFPGINYFWVGTILMMLGLTLSMWYRIRTTNSQKPKDENLA
ncbi:MAG: cytochrome c biogenesis protein CcsA [Bacteroidota bacterium]